MIVCMNLSYWKVWQVKLSWHSSFLNMLHNVMHYGRERWPDHWLVDKIKKLSLRNRRLFFREGRLQVVSRENHNRRSSILYTSILRAGEDPIQQQHTRGVAWLRICKAVLKRQYCCVGNTVYRLMRWSFLPWKHISDMLGPRKILSNLNTQVFKRGYTLSWLFQLLVVSEVYSNNQTEVVSAGFGV